MIEGHDLRDLTARLGEPHLEQITHRTGRQRQVAYYWGCGCTAMGIPAGEAPGPVRWRRCDHHAAAEAEKAPA
jgi:hypothetical protein